ncbi:hypothetical protein QFZ87_001479 [Bacillus sp. SLBN-46]|uniref:nucleotidyltransferase domain-containing protein n=1 Tax=Bacillus sp. SLBN-46 TaxID=3042283 RepID=UPI0028640AC4|nr:nucleotidyltransferase family protein [Bacillus sp. SLBN-46]MDR6121882.1 hypothetical protein [Bacillus sp. SLBN-46]
MVTDFCLNTTNIPKELKLIFEIIKLENIEKLSSNIRDLYKDIDWTLFLELSMHHRVYPLLFNKLRKIEEGLVPLYVIQTINRTYKTNTFHMLYLSREMEQINELFRLSQIRILFLKGPILGSELYGDISLRTSGDLDVLIPLPDLNKVNKILVQQGYVKDDYIQTVLNDWTWRHHHITYLHPQKGIKLEIHWRLNPGPGIEPSFSELWSRKQVSSQTIDPLYFLGREDLFLFLVSHGARHGWSRLRWLVDINQIIRKKINWVTLIPLLKKHQYLHVGGQALILASQLLGSSITKEMKPLFKKNDSKKLAQDAIFYFINMVNLHTEPVPDDVSRYHKRHLFSLMSLKQKLLYLLSILHPYPEDAKTLPLPKNLHFLYFILRPFLWFWRKTRTQAIQ